jgi:hypothetical protein
VTTKETKETKEILALPVKISKLWFPWPPLAVKILAEQIDMVAISR